jgi:muramidase (phage lysozyme)
MNSTAAGRYQFIRGTWAALQARLQLPNFSPLCQDVACIELLRENGAIPHIEAGNLLHAVEVAAAIRLDAPTWASLPGSDSGQPQRATLDLERVYGAALARYTNLSGALGL